MKSEIKKLDACLRQLDIEVGAETVTKKLDEVYTEISKKAKVPGFRPGAAPREILEKHHSQLAQEELIKALVPDTYEKSLQSHGLVSYSQPEISDVSLENNILKFKAKVEVRPEIILKSYKGIKVQRKELLVKDEDLTKRIEDLAKERGRENDVSVGFAKSLGYKSIDEFRETLKKQFFLQAQEQSYQDSLNQILEQLVKDNPITVPGVLAKRQLDRRLEDMRHKLKAYGAKEEEIEGKIKELQPQLEKTCEREVKVFLLLEEIARKENLKLKDASQSSQRAIEFLFENAKWG